MSKDAYSSQSHMSGAREEGLLSECILQGTTRLKSLYTAIIGIRASGEPGQSETKEQKELSPYLSVASQLYNEVK